MGNYSNPTLKSNGLNADALHEAAVALGVRRLDAEREVVAHIVAEPRTLVEIARAQCIDRDSFSEDDLRLWFIGIDLCQHSDRNQQFRVISTGLRQYGFWSEHGPLDGGPLWCARSMHRMFNAMFPSPAGVRFWCRKLTELATRQRLASEHISTARKLMGLEPSSLSSDYSQKPEPGTYPRLATGTPARLPKFQSGPRDHARQAMGGAW
jgi:hypothetical protein